MVLRTSKLIKTKYKYNFSKLNSDYMKQKKKNSNKDFFKRK